MDETVSAHPSTPDRGGCASDPEVPAKLGSRRLAPPGALNLVLAGAITTALLTCQWLAARATTGGSVLLVGVVFAFLFLPLYSLLHEAEHGTLHGNLTVNDGVGFFLAALFPGPFTFLRACHLGHHRRNRSDAEMFDLYYPHESLWRKRVTFYLLYLGGFWATVPAATLLLLLYPRSLRGQLVQDAPAAAAMVNGVNPRYLRRIRLESLFVVGLHTLLYWALDLNAGSFVSLYALAALSWSSQQYVTHAHAPRDVVNGAHNLKAHPLYGALLLNFNWHLAHHQHPAVPWLYLPRFDDPTRLRPGYLRAFLRFWRGPQPTAAPEEKATHGARPPEPLRR
jgi:fatty acid desaturase